MLEPALETHAFLNAGMHEHHSPALIWRFPIPHQRTNPIHIPLATSFPFPFLSFSSNFLLAFNTISSLLRRKSACRSLLLLLHIDLFSPPSSSSGVEGEECIFPARLYLVIKSTCSGVVDDCPPAVPDVLGVFGAGIGGWKDGGGYIPRQRISPKTLTNNDNNTS